MRQVRCVRCGARVHRFMGAVHRFAGAMHLCSRAVQVTGMLLNGKRSDGWKTFVSLCLGDSVAVLIRVRGVA